MKELIKIATNEKGIQCVSARELHEGLKVQQDFSDWIKKQLDNVNAIEEIDFTLLKGKSSGGRPSTEYILTTDIAKAINISDSNMSDFRNNKINFNDEKLELIINILDSAKGLLLLL